MWVQRINSSNEYPAPPTAEPVEAKLLSFPPAELVEADLHAYDKDQAMKTSYLSRRPSLSKPHPEASRRDYNTPITEEIL
jgi:hypothetical protein